MLNSPTNVDTEVGKLPQTALDDLHSAMSGVIDDLRLQTQHQVQEIINRQWQHLEQKLDSAFYQCAEKASAPAQTKSTCGVEICKATTAQPSSPIVHVNIDMESAPSAHISRLEFRKLMAMEMINRGGSQYSTTGMGVLASALNLDPHRVHSWMARKRLPEAIQKACSSIVGSNLFNGFVSGLIILNAAFAGLMANSTMSDAMSHWSTLPFGETSSGVLRLSIGIRMIDIVFAVLFTIELMLRLLANELRFCCGNASRINMLELFLVIASWVDIAFENVGSSEFAHNLNMVRVVRVFRVMRSLRVVRVLSLFQELRVVLLSLMGSVVPLFWALFCLFILLFVFIVIFMQGLAGFVREQPGGSEVVKKEVIPYFKDLPQAFCSLLMAITGGVNWEAFYMLMEKVSVLYSAIFVLYILVMTFGALNVITAIFVESATAKAREDSDIAKTEQINRARKLTKELMKLFRSIDPKAAGKISLKEWEILSLGAEVQAYFSMLNIDIGRAREVFRLLDIDNSGYIDIEEFVLGCMQIQGSASSVNVEMLMGTTRALLRKCNETFHRFETNSGRDMQRTFDLLNRILQRVDGSTLRF